MNDEILAGDELAGARLAAFVTCEWIPSQQVACTADGLRYFCSGLRVVLRDVPADLLEIVECPPAPT